MRLLRRASLLAGGGLMTAALAFAAALPANAATSSNFSVCGPTCGGQTYGTITWFNRTVGVNGFVFDQGPGSTTAYFEAFAGTRKIDSDNKTADDSPHNPIPNPRAISIPLGDPNLRGGVDRVKITVCFNLPSGRSCGDPQNYSRP
jgi:hypothetical protein